MNNVNLNLNDDMRKTDEVLEKARDRLEKVMADLKPEAGEKAHQLYLTGYIDALFDSHLISEQHRRILYAEFGRVS